MQGKIILLVFIFSANCLYSQSFFGENVKGNAPVDTVLISKRSLTNSNISTQSATDQIDPMSEVSIEIKLNNDLAGIDSIFITFGTVPGLGDVLSEKFKFSMAGNKKFLSKGEKNIEVVDGNLVLRYNVSNIQLNVTNYIFIRGKKKDGSLTNYIYTHFNKL